MIGYVLLLAGLAAVACSSTPNPPPKPPPLPPKKPEDESLAQNFADDLEAREHYLKLKALGVSDSQLDIGCSGFQYLDKRKAILRLGKGDGFPIQACEVNEFILDHYAEAKFRPLAEEITGGPIPWELDDGNDQTQGDAEIRAKIQAVLNELHATLIQQGLKKGDDSYKEAMAWGLLAFVALPPGGVSQFQKKSDLSPMEQSFFNETLENLKKQMRDHGLGDFWDEREKIGGIRIRGGNNERELSALDAIGANEGDCTENSKILFGAFRMAGLDPFFNYVDLWESEESVIQAAARENPHIQHINIGLKLGEKISLFEPTNLSPPKVKSGPLALSLRQYLAMDFSNRAVDRNTETSQAEQLLNRSRRLDPTSMFPLPNLANILIQLKRPEEALEVIRASLELNPQDAISYFMKGIALTHLEDKKNGEAMAALFQAIALNGNDYEFYLFRGGLFQRIEKYPDAERDFTNALRLAPIHAGKNLTERLTEVFAEKWKDPEKINLAKQIWKEARMEPGMLEMHFYLAWLYWRADQREYTFKIIMDFIQTLKPVRDGLKAKKQEFSREVLAFFKNIYEAFPPPFWGRYEIKPLWDSLNFPF